jgi:uncharacterized repeat protein (TIGR02543 family)
LLVFLVFILVACSIATYTITFDVDGGESIESIKVEENALVTRPNDPVKTGYDFIEWYEDADKTEIWNFSSKKVLKNITIYAKFSIQKFNVTFDVDGGSQVDEQRIDYNTVVNEPLTPTKARHDFIGWYKDALKLSEWNFLTEKVTKNTTIYAKWAIAKEGCFDKEKANNNLQDIVYFIGKFGKNSDRFLRAKLAVDNNIKFYT